MRLAFRHFNDGAVGKQQCGCDIVFASQFVSFEPQGFCHGQSLAVLHDLGDMRDAQPWDGMLFARRGSFAQRVIEFFLGPFDLALLLQLGAHGRFEFDQQFNVQRRIITPVTRQWTI